MEKSKVLLTLQQVVLTTIVTMYKREWENRVPTGTWTKKASVELQRNQCLRLVFQKPRMRKGSATDLSAYTQSIVYMLCRVFFAQDLF